MHARVRGTRGRRGGHTSERNEKRKTDRGALKGIDRQTETDTHKLQTNRQVARQTNR